jgi:hypothetical protein
MAVPVRRLGAPVVVAAESLAGVERSVQRGHRPAPLRGSPRRCATALGGWWLARKALLPSAGEPRTSASIALTSGIAVPRVQDEIGYLPSLSTRCSTGSKRGVEDKHRLIARVARAAHAAGRHAPSST